MGSDEARLGLALSVVSHRCDHQVGAVVGQHQDPGRRLDLAERDIDAELARDGPRHIDLVTLPRRPSAGAEQRIVVAHADADPAAAKDADQTVDAGLGACAGDSGCCTRIVEHPGQCGIGRTVSPRQSWQRGTQARRKDTSEKPHANGMQNQPSDEAAPISTMCISAKACGP
jgi:hypothetical protein